jgi:4-amino-4-deoxy-L-arabinose transferase-like glycosyltransferase
MIFPTKRLAQPPVIGDAAGRNPPGLPHWPGWVLGLAMGLALLLPLNILASRRFHHDEALYATWALQIASGQNPWLSQVPIDKPPLFLYVVAGVLYGLGVSETAARLPSLLATVATVGLTFRLGQRLYGPGPALLAAWLVALSPFVILFAPTALTDPLLVALLLAGGLAATGGRGGWAGFWLGLALATKQQALLFYPLLLALVAVPPGQGAGLAARRPYLLAQGRLLLAASLTFLPALLWDWWRGQSPGFWQLSLINYGGLAPSVGNWPERAAEFGALLAYGTASPLLNWLFGLGLPLRLGWSLVQWRSAGRLAGSRLAARSDGVLSLFCLCFLVGHVLLSFQVWDRYLLGLMPLLALLLARVLGLPGAALSHLWPVKPGLRASLTLLLIGLLVATLARPVQDAVNGRYPLGSNSAGLSGIEQIVAYLQGQAGANTTLYHRWLGTHWRFYLWGYPYDLHYWASPPELAEKAAEGHLIAFPAWRSETEARLALAEAGFRLRLLSRAYAPTGAPTISLYRLEPR